MISIKLGLLLYFHNWIEIKLQCSNLKLCLLELVRLIFQIETYTWVRLPILSRCTLLGLKWRNEKARVKISHIKVAHNLNFVENGIFVLFASIQIRNYTSCELQSFEKKFTANMFTKIILYYKKLLEEYVRTGQRGCKT